VVPIDPKLPKDIVVYENKPQICLLSIFFNVAQMAYSPYCENSGTRRYRIPEAKIHYTGLHNKLF